MAPKRRNKQVVRSVVKTKVVQETVEEVTTAIVGDQAAPALQALPTVDVSGSTSADVNVKQPKRGRREIPVSLQSQETQDPNEEQEEEEKQPETPRVASERKPRDQAKQKQNEEGGTGAGKIKKRRRRRLGASPGGDVGMGGVGGYKRYVWRVLKQVHPEMGLSGRAMEVLDMMMADMFERLANEAARLSRVTGRATLTSREVQSAVRLVLPGELGKHAISEGVKAVSKYMSG
ncbi:uncharacterized protein LOC133897708 [Phragmites australis]|uniref:uncharacterized protein LOC133897708 n=1 Tax=Phragmites australis TaxID=29695 RepID=UPI002D787541|nr:uncharacterized protein LOC133897708 [Phragmites australis]